MGRDKVLFLSFPHWNMTTGHTVQFCRDQHGSRFIQQKLEVSSEADKEAFFDEILPHTQRYVLFQWLFCNRY